MQIIINALPSYKNFANMDVYGLPWWLSSADRRCRFDPWVRKIPWRRKWQATPGYLPGKSHGQRNLAGYSPWIYRRVRHDLVTKQHGYT